jgi:hypothetical protein
VPTVDGYSWIEIPTTDVTLHEERGEAARIQRTAEVHFPTEWGDNGENIITNSPRRLVEMFEPTDAQPFMFARIWFRRDDEHPWILKHFGWIGGVGSATDLKSKFWVYDVAELLSGVPITESFNHPTLRQTVERISRLTNDKTPIPLSQVVLMKPETEAEWETLAENFREIQSVPDLPEDHQLYSLAETKFGATPKQVGDNFTAVTIDTGIDVPVANLDTTTFQANEHVLLDIYDWVEKRSGLKFHFEPLEESVALVADVQRSRRVFKQDSVAQQELEEEGETRYHETVTVIHNNALYEMNPTNTLHLRGDVAEGLLDPLVDQVEDTVYGFFGQSPPAEKFPVVKVQVPALVQAANGTELSPQVYESDATSLDTAEQEAIQELQAILEQPSEGEIRLEGVPRILPNDKLVAFEVCGDHVEFEQTPVEYEVESVEHTCPSTERYKTEVTVSIWANEKNIETVEKRMVEV